MAPFHVSGLDLTRALFDTDSPSHGLLRRSLTVNHTQTVTLGVIAAYTVAIALLWNLPYVRWSLWPFKVSTVLSCTHSPRKKKKKKESRRKKISRNHGNRCWSLRSTNSDTPSRPAAPAAVSSPSLWIPAREASPTCRAESAPSRSPRGISGRP